MKNNVNNIIINEIKKFINEGYVMEHENLKFTQNLLNSTFYNYNKFSNDYDIDITESNINVNWHIGFWLNDNGIENFIIVIDSVDGNFKLNYHDKHSDEIVQENIKDINEIKWKFKIENTTLPMNGTLYVKSLNFDFNTSICLVAFYQNNEQ